MSVTGTYTDPGSADTHTVDVDFGDGSTLVDQAVYGGAFSFDHVYSLAVDHIVEVCITDDDGGGPVCDTQTVHVAEIPNDPPEVEAGGPYSAVEGSPVALDGTVTDPDDNLDTIEWIGALGSFADDSVEDTDYTPIDEGTGSHTLTLRATDTLLVTDEDTATVTVTNVAPTIDSMDVDTPILEGSVSELSATFSDPGVNDVHTATVDWGEGAGPVAVDVHRIRGTNGGTV